MSWDPLQKDNKQTVSQLWNKIKRLERQLAEKSKNIIVLEAENAELKRVNSNLKKSNTMLKKKKTTE